jgi:hypothetical protein
MNVNMAHVHALNQVIQDRGEQDALNELLCQVRRYVEQEVHNAN